MCFVFNYVWTEFTESLMTGGLLCLPFSIAKQWSLSRSLVSVRPCVLFLTRKRYFSNATFVL